jgi:energy-coupling factor transporter transmembrane protein EcfT
MNPFRYDLPAMRPAFGVPPADSADSAPRLPFLHSPDAGTKLLSLALVSTSASVCRPILLVPIALSAIAILAKLDEKPAEIARASRFLLPMGIVILALRLLFPGDGRIFAPEALATGILYIVRMAIVFLLARAFYISTSVADLGGAITRAIRHLAIRGKVSAPDPGLYLGIAAGFLPRSFERYDRVRQAALARGFGTTRPKAGSILVLMETLIFSSIKSAVCTAEALEARCYSPDRTIAPASRGASDALLLAASILSLALSLSS